MRRREALVYAGLLVLLVVGATLTADETPASVPSPATPPSSRPRQDASTEQATAKPANAEVDPPSVESGITGEFANGTLFVQLEVRPKSARLLGHFAKSVPFRMPRSGEHRAVLRDADGNRAVVPFELRGLIPHGTDPSLLGDDGRLVVGDQVLLPTVPLVLRLPRAAFPATLTIVDGDGTKLAEVRIEP